MERISVLIPVYNGEQTIAVLCDVLMSHFAEVKGFQIVLVNDASLDNSGQLCKQLCREYPDIVTYVELSRNFGEHNALMAGLHYVNGDYCIIMDDDFQTPPGDALKLAKEIVKGYDVVYSYYEKRNDPLLRRLGSSFSNWVAVIVLNKPAGLYLSSFKCINRFLIDEIVKFDGQDPYIDGIILRTTDRIGTVCVTHDARRHGRSGYTLTKLVSLWGNMVLNFSLLPLRIIGILGLLLTCCSALYTLDRLILAEPVGGLTDHQSLMAILIFLVGLVFLSIAMLAEYIGRMHLFMTKHPQYVVRETLNSGSAGDGR